MKNIERFESLSSNELQTVTGGRKHPILHAIGSAAYHTTDAVYSFIGGLFGNKTK